MSPSDLKAPSSLASADPRAPLRRAVEQAVRAARAAGGPAIVRAHHSVALPPPSHLLASPALEGRLVAAWSDPVEGRSFAALEPALRLPLSGAGRFDEGGRLERALRERCFDAAWQGGPLDLDAPLLVAGFAFAEGRRPGPWQDWPDGELWVPRFLLHTLRGTSSLVVADAVGPEDTVDEVMARIGRRTLIALALVDQPTGDEAWRHRKEAAPPRDIHLEDAPTAQDEWRGRIDLARAQMREGAFDKVVLARCEAWKSAAGTRFDPLATAEALRLRQARCITFAWRRPDGTAFVGATPEILARLSDRQLSTVALAGTVRRGDGDDDALAAALLASAKDRHEQELVIRAIRAALAPMVEALHVPPEPRVARFADVQHLETRIEATVPAGRSLFELVARLHPTPAVGGLPAAPALAWMRAHEGLDRGWYAGPIGWLDARGNGAFAVAIRSALLRGDQAWAFAGCGIVPDSDADAEWRETLGKLQAVHHGLATTAGP